jgi:multisubunit Na+/H+ antiporter MnhG subunit
MLAIVLLTATITLIIIAPVVAIAICKTAKELKEEGNNDR